ncbi:MAG TPA: hypothetical protein PKV19_06340 [Anaerolineales bacterium]|nr:hypothetical protein [Anaerolineales bacterium]
MSPTLFAFIVFLTMLVTACAPLQTDQPDVIPSLAIAQPAVVVTAQGGGPAVGLPSIVPGSGGVVSPSAMALPADGVAFSENGKTFTMHIGESFLLNLGTDVYDWTVEVDHQDVLQRDMGVTVIQGAQGIYIAQAPGTVTLTANGDPLCLQSKPPCKMPSISFSIILIVE